MTLAKVTTHVDLPFPFAGVSGVDVDDFERLVEAVMQAEAAWPVAVAATIGPARDAAYRRWGQFEGRRDDIAEGLALRCPLGFDDDPAERLRVSMERWQANATAIAQRMPAPA